jgi:hypothetical protein
MTRTINFLGENRINTDDFYDERYATHFFVSSYYDSRVCARSCINKDVVLSFNIIIKSNDSKIARSSSFSVACLFFVVVVLN